MNATKLTLAFNDVENDVSDVANDVNEDETSGH